MVLLLICLLLLVAAVIVLFIGTLPLIPVIIDIVIFVMVIRFIFKKKRRDK